MARLVRFPFFSTPEYTQLTGLCRVGVFVRRQLGVDVE